MPLCLIYGDVGSGKTLLLAYLGTKVKPEIPIYANFKLNLPNYKPLEPEQLMDLPYDRAEIYIDEGYTAVDSRRSSSNMNRYYSYILFQSRKRGLDIYLTAQEPRVVDIRFKEMAKIIIFCNEINEGFNYLILYRRSFLLDDYDEYGFTMPYEVAKKYYGVYHTKAVVETEAITDMKNDFIFADRQKMTALIHKAFNDIKGDITTFSKGAVEMALIEKGYPQRLTKFVYVKVKDAIIKGDIKIKSK